MADKQKKMNHEDWKKYWEEMDLVFELSNNVQKYLGKYFEKITSGIQGRKKVLVPMCGKTFDLKWLANRQCMVVGVEYVEEAVQWFFSEQNLDTKQNHCLVAEDEAFKKYETVDGGIQIYLGDILKFNNKISAEDKFDFIWDRGAFSAVNISDRQKYIENIRCFMDYSSKWLMVTIDYDPEQFHGWPHFVTKEEVIRLFTGSFNIELLEDIDGNECVSKKTNWGVDWVKTRVYLFTLKNQKLSENV